MALLGLLAHWVLFVTIATIGYLLVWSTYNVFFHPLRKYRGPTLAAASRLHYIYHQLKGDLPFHLKRLHDQYGPCVRVAPDELSYNRSGAWNDICGHRQASRPGSFDKDPKFYTPPQGTARSIVNANDEDHRRMRRLQSHAFSEKALYEQESLLTKYVDLFIFRLWNQVNDPKVSGKVDIVRWFNFTTFDLIGDLAFGRSFNCLETGEMHPWIGMIFGGVKFGNIFIAANHIPKWITKPLALLVPWGLLEKQFAKFRFAADMGRQRMREGPVRADGSMDFMSYILRANDEKGMSEAEIQEATQIFIIAGSETTATLLSGAMFYLLKTPETLSKLVIELRALPAKDIQIRTLAALPYLNAVLEEALRIYPPVPTTLPRLVPVGGELILGEFVPGRVSVGLNQWSVMHSSSNFHLPETFAPERWLDDPRFANDDKKAFQPFSYGPRNCIGRNLAYAEMRLILAKLLYHFDVELMGESKDWANQNVFILWEKHELWVKLRAAEK